MKLVVLTSNSIRHKFVANSLSKYANDTLIVSESKNLDSIDVEKAQNPDIVTNHFLQRHQTEKFFFPNNDFFNSKTIPLVYKEVNLPYVYEVIKNFNPDLMICFGSSIIKDPLLSLITGRLVNLHLGMSPYYRGAGTNFWPFVNNELEYVGSTIHHIDAGVDSGDIICHVTPEFEIGDNVHTVGCKVIKASVLQLVNIMNLVEENQVLPRVKQWSIKNERYYKTLDFNKNAVLQYKKNMDSKMIENYLASPKKEIKLIRLENQIE